MSEPRRGRPRSEKAKDAVLDAAADLLLESGLTAVSMDEVAAHAGVSKATIYRWWPTKESLALEALYHEWESSTRADDTGALRTDLISLIRPWSRVIRRRPYGRVIAAFVIAAQTDPAFAKEYRQRFIQPRRDLARTVLARAVDRGEIPADTNVEVALDLLFGAIYHRLLHGHAPLTDRFVSDAVDIVLDGIIRP
jgi:AcrR family transcriptional regulator